MHSWNDGQDTDECAPEDETELQTGEAYDRAETLGNAPMGSRVTAQLAHDQRYYGSTNGPAREARRTRLRDRMGLGALFGGDDDD